MAGLTSKDILLSRVVGSLSHLNQTIKSMTASQKQVIEEMGFGSLVHIDIASIPKNLAFYVVTQLDTDAMVIRTRDGEIPINRAAVHRVYGFPMGNTIIKHPLSSHYNDVTTNQWIEHLDNVDKVHPKLLMDKIKGNKSTNFMFKVDFLVLMVSTLVRAMKDGRVYQRFLPSLNPTSVINEFDWCEFVVEAVKECKQDWIPNDRSHAFTGPLTFLVLLYCDHVSVAPDIERRQPMIVKWKSKDLKECQKNELLASYASGVSLHEAEEATGGGEGINNELADQMLHEAEVAAGDGEDNNERANQIIDEAEEEGGGGGEDDQEVVEHVKQPLQNPILRENAVDTPSPNPSPSKQTKHSSQKQKLLQENDPPCEITDAAGSPCVEKVKSPLPPLPPMANVLKRKLSNDFMVESGVSGADDTGVKVIMRVRPPNKNEEEGEAIVQKTSSDSLTILEQPFTFDYVADSTSTQVDIFNLVGAPLVENCLAGFNSSVFAYGQTGSGKTYTIWGPANALLEGELSSGQQGLTPRVFERLFARISEEQNKHAGKQLVYQCRCSFLEIYNEQITDLLDPTQKNLRIREDIKTGVYVENLTEESICSIKDVTQLLKKGLSNRRTGATSINIESSRSHGVFTCVVESRCKSMDGLSSLKTSRINLVDLAGSERQKLTRAAGERLKEAGNINRSLSQLGNLINILAEVSQSGKQRHIPYRDSKLTFLLQESLGGNAKLAMVCAISPAQSCKSETLSTLRFAQRAKAIKNKAVVNEVTQDDPKFLREIIRHLKEELLRMKSNDNHVDPATGYSTAWNARRSLNILKNSLSRYPMVLPRMDDDSDVEMEIVEEAEQTILAATEATDANNQDSSKKLEDGETPSLTIAPSEATPVLESPTPSVTPRVINSSRRSLRNSSTLTSSPETNRLAASLINGLEILDKHRKSPVLGRSSFRFPYKSVAYEPKPVTKEIGVQTISLENEFLCSKCKGKSLEEVKDANDDSSLQSDDNVSKQIAIPKAAEKVLSGSIRQEMALEELCTRQNAEIMQLNRLVQQYQHERECSSVIGQLQEDKIARGLENLTLGVLSTEEFADEELRSLANKHEILEEKYENHPEILKKGIELKNVQDELERYKNFFDMGERDVLIEEIQDLRIHLQLYTDCTPKLTKKESPLVQITNRESTFESAEQILESERIRFSETESKWNSLIEELKSELQESHLLAEKQRRDLDYERKCSEELKEALQMALENHARMLEQYVDLEEKHTDLLISKSKIQDIIEDVKKAAVKAGVRGAESRFINALATEISTLKVERENEKRRYIDEIKGLQEQLNETAEAVQAAGELIVRLREAEEAVALAQKQCSTSQEDKKIERIVDS